MSDRETNRYARNLDRVRSRRGPAGSLIFLRFTGAHEYEVALEVSEGWFAEYKKRRELDANQGKPIYLSVEVAALDDNQLDPILDEEWRLAVGGVVFTISKDHLTPPLASPRRWEIQAERTDDTYPPAEDE